MAVDDNEPASRSQDPSEGGSIPAAANDSKHPSSGISDRFVPPSFRRDRSMWVRTFGFQADKEPYARSRPNLSSHEYDGGGDYEAVGGCEGEDNSKKDDESAGDARNAVAAPEVIKTDSKDPLLRKESDYYTDNFKAGSTRESSLSPEDRDLEEGDGRIGEGFASSTDREGADPPSESRRCSEADVRDLSHKEEACASGSSFVQATLNGVNVLAGVGILSTPYAFSQGGWLSTIFLLAFSAICLYTGILLRRCLDAHPGIETYPDIGEAAFGRKGRLLISSLLYFELYCVTVEFLILEGDNLSSLFPFSGFVVANCKFTQLQVYVVVSALCMLPTLYLRNLSLLAYISAGGVIASVAIVSAVGYVGAFDGVGFHHTGRLIDVNGLPVAVGVYAFCFCGHAVFPSIYRSMRYRQDFSKVLAASFVVVTIIYAGIGALGYTMFGDEVESQVTLNLPKHLVSSRIAIWITLVNPFAKFALTLTPLAVALEEFLPWSPKSRQFFVWSIVIRTGLVVSIVAVALLVPFFGYLMAFIGSFMSITVAIITPCLCYLRIFGRRAPGVSRGEFSILLLILFVGLVTATVGTYSAIKGIIRSF